jgi:phage tail-like protein
MARPSYTDPVRNFKFQVTINPTGSLATHVGSEISKLGFSVVSGLTVTNELIAYREGGMNTHPHKMIGQSDFAPITLSKGVFGHERSLYAWQTFLHSWSQGGHGGGSTGAPNGNDYRCDLTVAVFDHPVSSGSYSTPGQSQTAPTNIGQAKIAYKIFNAWPGSYSLTDLNAGDSSIMIQQLVLNHEGFHVEWAPSATGGVDVAALGALQ